MSTLAIPTRLLPAHIERAPLLREFGGYRIVPGLLAPPLFAALGEEANQALAGARESNVPRYDREPWRGGNPARKFLSSNGGPVQESFYQHPRMLAFLAELTGCRVMPSGRRGTFTYYSRPGDYIGIHRDVDTCDLAVITCLHDSPPPGGGNAGKLVFYPARIEEDNFAIRRSPAEGAETHRLAPGETAILLGGVLAHAVLPVAQGQQRVVSVLCYTAVGG